jgi:hypothetical protein
MLLGREGYRRLMNETAGIYFLEKEHILNFQRYCVEPLELDDEEMRRYFFEHYRRLLYIRQPSDPDLMKKTEEIADYLNLSLKVTKARYDHLETVLKRTIRACRSAASPGKKNDFDE